MDELEKLVKKAFATTYGFLLVSECYHWNAEGDDFPEYHQLFGKIYDEVNHKIDKFAEEIRGLGLYVPATFSELSALSSIEEHTDNMRHTIPEMVQHLYMANNLVVTDLMNAYSAAEKTQKPDISAFLAKRIDKHHKYGWLLYSSMKV